MQLSSVKGKDRGGHWRDLLFKWHLSFIRQVLVHFHINSVHTQLWKMHSQLLAFYIALIRPASIDIGDMLLNPTLYHQYVDIYLGWYRFETK